MFERRKSQQAGEIGEGTLVVEPEWKGPFVVEGIKAPGDVESENNRRRPRMMTHEPIDQDELLFRIGRRHNQRNEIETSLVLERFRTKELGVRIAENRRIEVRVAAAACVGGARPLLGNTGALHEPKASGVIGIERRQKAERPRQQQRARRDEHDDEAAPTRIDSFRTGNR